MQMTEQIAEQTAAHESRAETLDAPHSISWARKIVLDGLARVEELRRLDMDTRRKLFEEIDPPIDLEIDGLKLAEWV